VLKTQIRVTRPQCVKLEKVTDSYTSENTQNRMFNIPTHFFSLLLLILQLPYSSIDSLVGYLHWGFSQVLSVSHLVPSKRLPRGTRGLFFPNLLLPHFPITMSSLS